MTCAAIVLGLNALGCGRMTTDRLRPAMGTSKWTRRGASICQSSVQHHSARRPSKTTITATDCDNTRDSHFVAQWETAFATPCSPLDLQCTTSVSVKSSPGTASRPSSSLARARTEHQNLTLLNSPGSTQPASRSKRRWKYETVSASVHDAVGSPSPAPMLGLDPMKSNGAVSMCPLQGSGTLRSPVS